MYYAKLVQNLGIAYYLYPRRSSLHVNHAALSTMVTFRPTAVLFPHARSLDWSSLQLEDESLPVMLAMLGPRMKRIVVDEWGFSLDEPRHSFQLPLAIIASNFPLLEDFDLSLPTSNEDDHLLWPALQLISQKLTRLKSFACNNIYVNEQTFWNLGKLSGLTSLDIRLPAHLMWSSSNKPRATFPALRDLAFTMFAHDYIRFSTIATFPTAKTLNLTILGPPGPLEIPALFASICAQTSATSLVEVNIFPVVDDMAPNRDVVQQSGSVLQPAHMQPLLSLKRLQTLTVDLACRYALTTEFYMELAKALPEAASIWLGEGELCVHDLPYPDIRCLPSFARHCPKLSSIAVHVDGSTQPISTDDVQSALPSDAPPSHVDHLRVGVSRIGDPQGVAAYLACIFPDLDASCLTHSWNEVAGTAEAHTYRRKWDQVQASLPWFKVLQSVERERVTSVGRAE